MYVDGYLSRKRNQIRIAERVNGERLYRTFIPQYTLYYEHAGGGSQTIYRENCQKQVFTDEKKFKRQLDTHLGIFDPKKKRKIFESDINPLFRCLADNYSGAATPNLHIAFFDIETAFYPERGYAPPSDPFADITGITVYLKWLDRLITLALCPPTINIDVCREMVQHIPDTFVFEEETELLQTFIALIDDVDVLSGWNCIDQKANVWLHDRIKPLGRVVASDLTFSTGSVKAFNNSGPKQANRLELANGMDFLVSDEHRIPVMRKHKDSFKYPSSLRATVEDLTVAEMKDWRSRGYDLYMTQALRHNRNKDLTWRDLIVDNLDVLMDSPTFDVAILSESQKKAILALIPVENRDAVFGCSRAIQSPQFYPRRWKSKNFGHLSVQDVAAYIENENVLTVVPEAGRPFKIRLDDPISSDLLALLGLVFTDGTRYAGRRVTYSVYNTEFGMLREYKKIAIDEGIISNATKKADIKIANDGCGVFRMTASSLMGVLDCLIYNGGKKDLNIGSLSRLSRQQFSAFYAGLVDGDGTLSGGKLVLYNYDGQTKKIVELLAWNGVFSHNKNNTVFTSCCEINEPFIRNLPLRHEHKNLLRNDLSFFKRNNSPAKSLKKFVDADEVILRIDSLDLTEDFIPMADIQTEGSYFHCHGIRVHNSEYFDIPYIVNRIKCLIGDNQTRDLCLWNERPRERTMLKFGREVQTYDLIGRVHLDYLALYRKHNTQQLHSYRLGYVGEIEVGETKVAYTGNLDDLWKKDFVKFIDYNRQDVMLLQKIDEKRKFIELANQVAHANCVPLKTTMGSVALVEQAIINAIHPMGFVVHDRKRTLEERGENVVEDVEDFDEEDEENEEDADEKNPVAGAYVADPKRGEHDYIACCDINSLYPSAIRALNMSPETIVGQFDDSETVAFIESRARDLGKAKRAEAWLGVFATLEYSHIIAEDDTRLTLIYEDGREVVKSAREWHEYIFNPANNLCLTANGTVFSTKLDGIIPMLLGKWYAERKVMQSDARTYEELADGRYTIKDQNVLKALQELFADEAKSDRS